MKTLAPGVYRVYPDNGSPARWVDIGPNAATSLTAFGWRDMEVRLDPYSPIYTVTVRLRWLTDVRSGEDVPHLSVKDDDMLNLLVNSMKEAA